jgi:molybdopterin synthase sulfur carrier subunit
MSVIVKLPTQLRDSVGGASEAQAEGETVGEVLESLFVSHPALRDRIADGNGVRRFVNVYVSGEDRRFLDGTDTPVSEGAEITILPAVAGG